MKCIMCNHEISDSSQKCPFCEESVRPYIFQCNAADIQKLKKRRQTKNNAESPLPAPQKDTGDNEKDLARLRRVAAAQEKLEYDAYKAAIERQKKIEKENKNKDDSDRLTRDATAKEKPEQSEHKAAMERRSGKDRSPVQKEPQVEVNLPKKAVKEDIKSDANIFIIVGMSIIVVALFVLSWFLSGIVISIGYIFGSIIVCMGLWERFSKYKILPTITIGFLLLILIPVLTTYCVSPTLTVGHLNLQVNGNNSESRISYFVEEPSTYYFDASALNNIGNYQISSVSKTVDRTYIRIDDGEGKGPIASIYGYKFTSASLLIKNENNGIEKNIKGYCYSSDDKEIIYIALSEFLNSFGLATDNPDSATINIVAVD